VVCATGRVLIIRSYLSLFRVMFPCIKLSIENVNFFHPKHTSVNRLEKENYIASFIIYLNIGLLMFLSYQVGGKSRVNHGI
jgi:hypothetical protein